MMKKVFLFLFMVAILAACKNKNNSSDASGTFEAIETIVSAEASGTIKSLDIEEGKELKVGQQVGFIDSLQLYLKKRQLQAQIGSVLSKRPNANAQLAALGAQLKQAEREQKRISNLLKEDAATQKQLDDANSQIEILKKQLSAQGSTLEITSSGITHEASPLQVQILQLNDQLEKCKIINPASGTVLTKYAEVNEVTTNGKPVYKIAELSSLILRAYISGDQLPKIKINQKVKVLVDSGKNNYKYHDGIVEWISDKAEFTPKTIQTKDERANLVYAVKIKVKNDGYLKIGMYGEVKL